MNQTVLFNDGWEFAKSGLDVSSSDTLTFEPVDLPHDWLIYNTENLYETSIGWYKKVFYYSPEQKEQVLLRFDGVYMDSSLYVNGTYIGEWKNGYSSFEHDITQALVEGANEILMKIVYQSPNSRWYSGAGIYRNVYLKTREQNHIVTDGIYVSVYEKEDRTWAVEVDTEIVLEETLRLTHKIVDQDNTVTWIETVVEADKNTVYNSQGMVVNNPKLWSTEKPNRYHLITELHRIIVDEEGNKQEEPIEKITQTIGFRTIKMDPNQGFFLNGRRMKLNGVCEHHDLGALGAAFYKVALRRRFEILKEMGVNAIRTAHNMPAVELMELADEMGMLIVSEAFDMWERPKTKYDYARFFKDWAYRDVKSWVRRDRNHPSLMLWSIGNEIYDTHADERGQELTKLLMGYVQEFDPKGNANITIGSNYMPWENARKCADIVKIAGYNYGEKYYQDHHESHPDWVIYGSETSSVVQSRGIYHFPLEKSILADDDEQCSALGNSSTSWGAKSPEVCIIAERDTPFSMGQFLWTGFDYIGEPTPYHTKNSFFGQIDTATFKKDPFYIYQAEWTDYKTAPMVHIFPYWDFSPGQTIDVRVCSNAPRVELQLNGRTIGTFDIDHAHGTQLVGWWKVPYEAGILKALAYDEDGNVIATDVQKSFGDAKRIRLKPDKETMVANGTDLIFLEISMEDEDGNPVENASNRVHVNVTGAGRLVGLDNGDSTDYDQYKGVSRKLFQGKLMAIIAATLDPGTIKVEVTSKCVEGRTVELRSVTPNEDLLEGISANTRNQATLCIMGTEDEMPLRKIEIISPAGQTLDETKKEVMVRAKLYPDNTSYQEVEWSVVNDIGVVSNIAKIEPNGLEAKVSAFGDGEFRVRCTSKNGSDKTKLISELEFCVTGLGTAYKDPYGFISGGLYDDSKGEVGNGNERGIATSRDGETQVCFREIDFGPYGSDTITIPIFALSNAEYALQIWEGMPEEAGSELLADVIYQKESRWNVYQEETYRLSKRLCGITSICFVLHAKVHIKGFYFESQNRAFEKNLATESDHIYGDTFTIKDTTVEGIGNNVSLEFEHFDFGEDGAKKLVIYGHSPIDKNTIHVRFANEGDTSNQIVEFTKTEGYEEHTYELENIKGKQKVTFVFLPGCDFDFGWFRFE